MTQLHGRATGEARKLGRIAGCCDLLESWCARGRSGPGGAASKQGARPGRAAWLAHARDGL